MNSVIQKRTSQQLSVERVAVLERMTVLTKELVNELAEKKSLASALKMSDNELAQLIFETQLIRSSQFHQENNVK